MAGDERDPKKPRDERESESPRSLSSSELSRQAANAFRGAAKTAESLQKKLSSAEFRLDLGAVDAHARTLLQPDAQVRAPKRRTPQVSPTWRFQAIPRIGVTEERLKGLLPHAVHHWILRAFGDAGIRAIAPHLQKDIAARFETDAFNALEWCTLDEVHEVLEVATAKLFGGHAIVFRELAAENYPFELAGVFRSTSKTPDLVIKRCPIAWARLLDFGKVRVLEDAGQLTLRFDDFSRVGSPLRNIITGTMLGLLSTTEPKATAAVTMGVEPFSPELHLTFDWATT